MHELDETSGATCVALATDCIAERLHADRVEWRDEPWLDAEAATFVTLVTDGELRGCIGTLEAHRCLRADLVANALAAAFHDSRFPPLSLAEWAATEIEVSVLSALTPLPFGDEASAMARLRPGIDGVVLAWRGHRATFLPKVWEELPDPRDFLRHLRRKALLPDTFWAQDIRLSRYTVRSWGSGALRS
jgi:hypothetical protein